MTSFLRPVATTAFFEFDILPTVYRGPIISRIVAKDIHERLNRRFAFAGRDIDSRMDDREVVIDDSFCGVNDIKDQFLWVHRTD